MYALASDAMLLATKRRVAALDAQFRAHCEALQAPVADGGRGVPADELPSLKEFLDSLPASAVAVMVGKEDFLAAAGALVPSLSQEELAHYAKLKEMFKVSN